MFLVATTQGLLTLFMLRCIDVDRIVKGCRRCRVWNGLGINKKYARFGLLKVIVYCQGF